MEGDRIILYFFKFKKIKIYNQKFKDKSKFFEIVDSKLEIGEIIDYIDLDEDDNEKFINKMLVVYNIMVVVIIGNNIKCEKVVQFDIFDNVVVVFLVVIVVIVLVMVVGVVVVVMVVVVVRYC